MRHYKIVSGKNGGTGSFLAPPGDPALTHSLHEFTGPRGRTVIGISHISYALTDEADAAESIKATVRNLLERAQREPSELWVRNVYGYFRSMYAPESGTRNVSDAISDSSNSLPAERHLGFLCVREYFPDHEPRLDLIADPGKGYGSYPCLKCDERVQYEARFDALVKVTTRLSGSGITQWSYAVECFDGSAHVI